MVRQLAAAKFASGLPSTLEHHVATGVALDTAAVEAAVRSEVARALAQQAAPESVYAPPRMRRPSERSLVSTSSPTVFSCARLSGGRRLFVDTP